MNPNVENRVTGFLGLCMRAGRIISGQEACVELIRQGGAALALIDAAASENTRKRVLDACRTHDVALFELSAGALGGCIGKQGRMVVALQADGMAQKLMTLLEGEPRL